MFSKTQQPRQFIKQIWRQQNDHFEESDVTNQTSRVAIELDETHKAESLKKHVAKQFTINFTIHFTIE